MRHRRAGEETSQRARAAVGQHAELPTTITSVLAVAGSHLELVAHHRNVGGGARRRPVGQPHLGRAYPVECLMRSTAEVVDMGCGPSLLRGAGKVRMPSERIEETFLVIHAGYRFDDFVDLDPIARTAIAASGSTRCEPLDGRPDVLLGPCHSSPHAVAV